MPGRTAHLDTEKIKDSCTRIFLSKDQALNVAKDLRSFSFRRRVKFALRVSDTRYGKPCIYYRPVTIYSLREFAETRSRRSCNLLMRPREIRGVRLARVYFKCAPEGKVFQFSKRTPRLSHRSQSSSSSSSTAAAATRTNKAGREDRVKERARGERCAGRSLRVDQPATRKSRVYVIFLALG